MTLVDYVEKLIVDNKIEECVSFIKDNSDKDYFREEFYTEAAEVAAKYACEKVIDSLMNNSPDGYPIEDDIADGAAKAGHLSILDKYCLRSKFNGFRSIRHDDIVAAVIKHNKRKLLNKIIRRGYSNYNKIAEYAHYYNNKDILAGISKEELDKITHQMDRKRLKQR